MKLSGWKRNVAALLLFSAVASALPLSGCHRGTVSTEDPGLKRDPLTEKERELNLESFDYIWNTIRKKFWDPQIMGLDWKEIGERYRTQVSEAEYMSEARETMNEMLSELGQSHFGVIPREAYTDITGSEGSSSSSSGEAGITARIRGGKPLVVSVREGSPAEEAGIKPGWEILSINGRAAADRLSSLRENLAGKPFLNYSLNASLLHSLAGSPGDTLKIRFIDGSGNELERALCLEARKGRSSRFGYLPEIYVWLDYSEIENDIGYIAFSSFFDPMHLMPKFNRAISEFMNKKGIIIDIRGNPGGIGGMAMGMSGWFVSERGRYLGKLSTRDSELKLIINPRPETYQGRVAVLVDEMSTSASEFLAGGLQSIGAAKVFGTRTPGAALPSVIDQLPNGDAFQYVIGNYTAEDGTRLEGNGVIPDYEITPGRSELLESGDPVIGAAVDWIREE
ncbi:MAG: PDZ domain-containing protein [Candidatus Latescibacteria bacterium]|nr:PDZ domain-containing protein [bacterium]MBD3425457.1 PDZ domain-containing protein [Candidatus Latescibacterota bacterium]